MNDPFDDPGLKAYLRRAKSEMFPKLKGSAVSLTIYNGDPDPKLCLELGAAILFDKPIVVLVPDKGESVPANLKRCASRIIYGDLRDPLTQQQITAAVKETVENDARSKS